MKIIVCDPDIVRLRNLRSILASIGYKAADVENVIDPKKLVNSAKKARFDVIFLSMEQSSKTNGLEMLKQVREDRRLHSMPVVLYSDEVSHELVMDASAAGVSGFLGYPFSVSDVESSLKSATKKKNLF